MDVKVSLSDQNEDGFSFDVSINAHNYKVTVTKTYYQKLTGGKINPEELIKKSFEFLLERESPEQILREFDLPLIGKYFPEYEEEIVKAV